MEVRDEVRQLAQPMCDEEGLELVDVETVFQGRRMVVRVLLDKPGGVTVGDCARFSRRLSEVLDMNQTIAGSYALEVSSPGLERPLPTLAAVERFAGSRAGLALREPHEGRRNFDGILLTPRDSRAGIRTEDGQEHWFDWSEVRSVRLIVDPWAELRKPDARHRRAVPGGASSREGHREQ